MKLQETLHPISTASRGLKIWMAVYFALLLMGQTASAAGLVKVWSNQNSEDLSPRQNPAQVNFDTDVDASRIFFRADSGQVQIQDVQLTLDDGSTLGLSDLVDNNRQAFGPGVLDHTGAVRFNRSAFLDFGDTDHVTHISVTFQQNVTPSSVFISLLSGQAGSGSNPQPPPVVNPPSGNGGVSSGNSNPPPYVPAPPAVNPAPTCDMFDLGRQIGVCSNQDSTLQSNLSDLNGRLAYIQGQASGYADDQDRLNRCQTESQELANRIGSLRADAEQTQSAAANLQVSTTSLKQGIANLNSPVPRGYKCWLRDRHGNYHEESGPGTQVDVLKKILQDSNGSGSHSPWAGEGSIGKIEEGEKWHMDGNWACDPVAL